MSYPSDTSRLHSMYDPRVPQPSSVWNEIKWVEFQIPARSRFMHAVNTLRQTSPTPVCMKSQRLANGEYRIVVNLPQLQRIVAQALRTPFSQL